MKKLLIVFVATASILVGGFSSVHAAVPSIGDSGRAWSIPNDASLGQHIQQFLDSQPNEVASFLIDNSKRSDSSQDPTCSGPSDPKCDVKSMFYTAVIPRCQSETDVNCTVDFGTIDSSGNKTSASFSRYFPNHALNEFQGDATKDVPSGVAGSLYSLPSATHDGGDNYYVSVVLSSGFTPAGKSNRPDLDVKISPVKIETSGYFTTSGDTLDAGWAKITDHNTGVVRWGGQASGYSGNQYCVANSAKEKLCAQKYAFPADSRFYVSIRLTQLPVGWMHGRLSSPDIKITAGAGSSTIEIDGNPIAVPSVYKLYNYVDMPDALKSQYDVKKGGYINSPYCINTTDYCAGGRSGPSTDPLKRNVIISPEPWRADGMEQLKLWLPYVGDKATALPSFWSARTLTPDEMNNSNRCFSDNSKITGIVTTNSTQYSAGPPTLNKVSGTLDYKVASPHFGTTGDVFKGSYDLVMRSDVARCVYGFSKAPINATISVTSADGTPQIATTVVGEKDGWLYLQAKNFEFSAPTVTAKLTQDAPAVISKPVVKKITCVKGKVSKVVTTAVCPVGFKRK